MNNLSSVGEWAKAAKRWLNEQRFPLNRSLVAMSFSALLCAASQAGAVAGWNFSALVAGDNFGPTPFAAGTADSNTTIGGLTRTWTCGSGTAASAAWGGNNFSVTANTRDLAIAANNFATFTITAKAGYQVSLSDIPAYNIRRSGTGPATGLWQYRIGSGSFVDIGSAITWGSVTSSSGNPQTAITLSGISALQNVPAGTTITIRLVTWGATSAGGTWYLKDLGNSTANDLILNGTVTAVTPVGDTDSKAVAPVTQVAAGDVSSLATTPGAAVDVLAFALQDLGTSDANATQVTQLTVKPASGNTASWAANIQGVKLYNVSDAAAVAIGTPAITDASLVIPLASGNLSIPDGAAKEIRLSVYLKTGSLADNAVLKFKVDSAAPGFASDPAASSGFAPTFPADITGNAMTLRVSASKLAFASVPSSVGIGQTFSATVQAQDANGNLDLDEATAVTVSKATGNGTLTGGGAQNLIAGAKAFAALSFDTPGTNTLQAAGGSLASAVSGAIVVSHPLSILHVNDMHARVTPHYWQIPQHGTNTPAFELVGGAAYLAAKMLSLKSGNPNSLVLDAGDISEGNPLGDLRGNGAMVDFYNILDAKLKSQGGRGLDASVVGNHDVRFRSYIDNLRTNAHYPVIAMNICSNGTKNAYFAPYVIVNVNGTRVGILGYCNENGDLGPETSNLLSVVKCDWTSADSTKIHVKDYVTELRTVRGCDLVVLLAHIGQTAICADTGTSSALLVDDGTVRVPEVAITGHWHSWAETVWQPSVLNHKTIFAESGSYMKYIGELQVAGDGRYVCATQHVIRCADLTPVPEVTNQIAALEAEYAANTNLGFGMTNWPLHEVVGYTADDLLLDNNMKWWTPNEYPWSGDNTAGQWICDAMCWKAARLFGQCDLSIESGGGVRSDIPAGPVTFMQIYETFPWNDDLLCVVTMTGQEIWNYIKGTACNAGFSKGWIVTAHDGVPINITYNNQPISLSGTYQVAINNYMYANPPSGVTWSDANPRTSTYLCRDALVEYTRQYTEETPMSLGGPRYRLDTEFSGGFRAVVTMLNNNDSRVIYESAFARLLTATPETTARRGSKQVPASLVNADGTIVTTNRLSEIEFYRSFLAFRNTPLRVGDIVEIWGKNSAYQGNPEFVDQEGIQADGVEFKIVGHDDTLARPEYHPAIASFWNDDHKNHYVRFFARKTGTSTVADVDGNTLSLHDVTGFTAKTLPGSNGDLLQIDGVPTSENFGLRFRCGSAVTAASVGITAFPPASAVDPVPSFEQTAPALALTAVAGTSSSGQAVTELVPEADAQVASGNPGSNYGTGNNLYIQSSASGFGNERAWLKFNLATLPAGTTIASARLKMFCWKAGSSAMAASVHGLVNDALWTETGLNWNNQPTFGSALDTLTLASGAQGLSYSWDVTSFVQGEWSGDKKASLLVKPVAENDASSPSFGFDAREYNSGANTPLLDIYVAQSGPTQTITQVQFFYRYSVNNLDWSAWTAFQTVSSAPWTGLFNYPSGYGFYQFCSVATDSAGNTEPAPYLADASVRFKPETLHTLTAAASANGTVTPSTALVAQGGRTNFAITAATYFHVADVRTNGVSIGGAFGVSALDYTWLGVTADGTLAVDFAQNLTPGGTPEIWLAQHGLTVEGDNSDTDGDGMKARDEYVAGTSPTNPGSVLKVTEAGLDGATGWGTLQWPSVAGRTYDVEHGTNLSDAVPFQPLLTDIPATPSTNSCSVPALPGGQHFFRLKVRLAP